MTNYSTFILRFQPEQPCYRCESTTGIGICESDGSSLHCDPVCGLHAYFVGSSEREHPEVRELIAMMLKAYFVADTADVVCQAETSEIPGYEPPEPDPVFDLEEPAWFCRVSRRGEQELAVYVAWSWNEYDWILYPVDQASL